MNIACYFMQTVSILSLSFACSLGSTATYAAPAENKQGEYNKVWALGELLLAEEFQSHAEYSKTRMPLKNGWSIHANHAKWVRTSSGVQSVWESGHMPVLKIEGDFHHCLIEVDFRFREEDGRWGGCRISTGHSELLPRAYAVSTWANQSNDARPRGLVLEQDTWKPGFITTIDRKPTKLKPDTWYTLRLEVFGDTARATCDGAEAIGSFPTFSIPKNSISLGVGTATHELRNLRVYRVIEIVDPVKLGPNERWEEVLPNGRTDQDDRSYVHLESKDKEYWKTVWKKPGKVTQFVEGYEYVPEQKTEIFNVVQSPDDHRRVEYRGPDYESGTYRFVGELLIDDDTTDDLWVMQVWHAVLVKFRRNGNSGDLIYHSANSASEDARVGPRELAKGILGKRVKFDVVHSGAPDFGISMTISVDGTVLNNGQPYRFKTFDAGGSFYIKYGAYCGPGQAQTVKWIDTHIYQKKPGRQ